MAVKRGSEFATIDVVAVCLKSYDENADEICIDTANKVSTTVATETSERVALIIKGVVIAQKPQVTTVTGNTLVLTDNVFNAQEVELLQGGTVKYDEGGNVIGYTPPVSGQKYNPKLFQLITYSAIYNAAAVCVGYERMTFPNCQGQPISFNIEDGAFRATDYTINSAPAHGEPPYDMDIIAELPPEIQAILDSRAPKPNDTVTGRGTV